MVKIYLKELQDYLDLDNTDPEIKFNKQINDVADIETRQTNYTNSFNIAKTDKNTYLLNQLGIAGDVSKIPYRKVPISFYYNGIELIQNGNLIIKETNNEYKAHIYDGLINFYKIIEGVNIGSLDLSEIEHQKNISTVVNSFTNENYRYILNDYGGKNFFNNSLNIDYQVPSVRYKYLFEKIMNFANYTFVGEIFNHLDYLETWITYPKGQLPTNYETELYADLRAGSNTDFLLGFSQAFPFFINNASISTAAYNYNLLQNVIQGSLINNWQYIVPSTNLYELDLTALGSTEYIVYNGFSIDDTDPTYYDWYIYVNGVFTGLKTNSQQNNFKAPISLNQGDIISLLPQWANNGHTIDTNINGQIIAYHDYFFIGDLKFKIKRIVNEVNFTEELNELSIADFIKDFLNRFSLTMFLDEEKKEIIFKTFDERLQTDTIDWSDKYIERTTEIYTLPSKYSKKNIFKHKYNEENQEYNDGTFIIDNENLKEKSNAYNSFLYSPEKNAKSFIINGISFQTKLYDSEVNDNNGIVKVNYKELASRFYLIRSKTIQQILNITSETYLISGSVNSYPIADFKNVTLKYFAENYYKNYKLMLDDFRLEKIKLALSYLDFINLDFDKIYYFYQEKNYFILNKLNFEIGKIATAEFLRVKQLEFENDCTINLVENFFINITNDETNNTILSYIIQGEIINLIFQFSYDGINWIEEFSEVPQIGVLVNKTNINQLNYNKVRLKLIPLRNNCPVVYSEVLNYEPFIACGVKANVYLSIYDIQKFPDYFVINYYSCGNIPQTIQVNNNEIQPIELCIEPNTEITIFIQGELTGETYTYPSEFSTYNITNILCS